LEVVVTPQNGGRAAAAAYQRLLEFINDELMDEFEVSLHADDLNSLEEDEKVDLDEVDLDEIELDEDEVDDLDDLDDQLMDDDEDDEWGDDDNFSFR
jgi:ribonuclease E